MIGPRPGRPVRRCLFNFVKAFIRVLAKKNASFHPSSSFLIFSLSCFSLSLSLSLSISFCSILLHVAVLALQIKEILLVAVRLAWSGSLSPEGGGCVRSRSHLLPRHSRPYLFLSASLPRPTVGEES